MSDSFVQLPSPRPLTSTSPSSASLMNMLNPALGESAMFEGIERVISARVVGAAGGADGSLSRVRPMLKDGSPDGGVKDERSALGEIGADGNKGVVDEAGGQDEVGRDQQQQDKRRDESDERRRAGGEEVQDENAREGHLYPLEGMKLLKTGEDMWVPETQEAGYMTDDMIKEQEDIFERLGTSAEAAKIRARMQCAQLQSDMEAFKAANPHATLEDFVRWHSPRDWIEEEDRPESQQQLPPPPAKLHGGGVEGSSLDNAAAATPSSLNKEEEILAGGRAEGEVAVPAVSSPSQIGVPVVRGRLSARMTERGNLWQEVWEISRRIPAKRQKPLFDSEKEAEKVLNYLETMSQFDILSQILPTFFLIAYDILVSHPVVRHVRILTNGARDLASKLISIANIVEDEACLQQMLVDVYKLETSVAMAVALLRKLPKQYELVERILLQSETVVRDGDEREAVYDMLLSEKQGTGLPSPISREYCFRTFSASSSSEDDEDVDDDDDIDDGSVGGAGAPRFGNPLPQRMYFLLREDDVNEFRIVETVAKSGIF
ncbi:Rab3 GTPase-activating protein catalytic subunit [Quaeritorhiza haematococci]|nr:Rab3 GTPase-activating protein catalytic subunit [Quaeritorhiza haematococci]